MKNLTISVKNETAYRLSVISKWNACAPETMAKYILDNACAEIWQENKCGFEEMMRGLEYYQEL